MPDGSHGRFAVYPVDTAIAHNMIMTYYKTIVVALATGRRFTEIIHSLEISRERGRNKPLIFSGLTKKKDGKNSGIGHLLISKATVNNYLKSIRRNIDMSRMPNSANPHVWLNSKYSKSFNKNTRLIYPKASKFHDLRFFGTEAIAQKFDISRREAYLHEEERKATVTHAYAK